MSSVTVAVRRWHAWAPGRVDAAAWQQWLNAGAPAVADSGNAPVEFVEPMLRRRLSPLSRVALHCAQAALAGERASQLIFASRHGELGNTVNLLRQLAQAESLSPMGFSLSVHNTAAGLYGIAARDATPATAIAAGRDTLSACLIEAAAMLACGVESVLVSYVEQDLPTPYQAWQQAEAPLLGLALLLEQPGAASDARRLTVSAVPASGNEYRSPGVAMIQLLLDQQPVSLTGEQRQWSMVSG